jgi:hypothetical protein
MKEVMKKILTFACLLISSLLLLSGCGNSEYQLSKQDMAAFKDATPEMKQAWEQGLKADRANDYLTAGSKYRALLTNTITAEQLVAVQTALGGLNQRINEAAAKGDPVAQKALEAAKGTAPKR